MNADADQAEIDHAKAMMGSLHPSSAMRPALDAYIHGRAVPRIYLDALFAYVADQQEDDRSHIAAAWLLGRVALGPEKRAVAVDLLTASLGHKAVPSKRLLRAKWTRAKPLAHVVAWWSTGILWLILALLPFDRPLDRLSHIVWGIFMIIVAACSTQAGLAQWKRGSRPAVEFPKTVIDTLARLNAREGVDAIAQAADAMAALREPAEAAFQALLPGLTEADEGLVSPAGQRAMVRLAAASSSTEVLLKALAHIGAEAVLPDLRGVSHPAAAQAVRAIEERMARRRQRDTLLRHSTTPEGPDTLVRPAGAHRPEAEALVRPIQRD